MVEIKAAQAAFLLLIFAFAFPRPFEATDKVPAVGENTRRTRVWTRSPARGAETGIAQDLKTVIEGRGHPVIGARDVGRQIEEYSTYYLYPALAFRKTSEAEKQEGRLRALRGATVHTQSGSSPSISMMYASML